MDRLVKAGKIKAYGVSVEWIEEAIKALEYPIASVQIIFNMFRQRPTELFFDLAKRKNVAIIARVPLASGLLSGKFNSSSTFAADDHRAYNRNGEAFDKGETFSGIPYETGLQAVEELRPLVPAGATEPRVCIIPAKRPFAGVRNKRYPKARWGAGSLQLLLEERGKR